MRAPRPRRRPARPPVPIPSDALGTQNAPRHEVAEQPAQQPQGTDNQLFADLNVVAEPNFDFDVDPAAFLNDDFWPSTLIDTE